MGSTPSRSYSVMGARLSMMAFRSTVICETSSSVRPMRVYSAMSRTSWFGYMLGSWGGSSLLVFTLRPAASTGRTEGGTGENITSPMIAKEGSLRVRRRKETTARTLCTRREI